MREKHKTSKNGSKTAFQEGKPVKIDYVFPDGRKSTFVNHATISHTEEGEFHVCFYEIAHPMIMGDEGAIAKALSELDSVQAECVAKLVISAERLPKMIGALATNYNKYLMEKREQSHESSEDKIHEG